MLAPLVVAGAAFVIFLLARAAPVPRGRLGLAVGLGVVLGLLGWAVAQLVPKGPVGVEEGSALVLLFAVGLSTMRWGTVTLDPGASRARCAWMATASLMGLVGALAHASPSSTILGGFVVALAATRMHPFPTRAWPFVLGLLVFAWPLMAERMPSARAVEGFAAVAAGALVGWLALQERGVPERAWPALLLGFLVGLAPAALT